MNRSVCFVLVMITMFLFSLDAMATSFDIPSVPVLQAAREGNIQAGEVSTSTEIPKSPPAPQMQIPDVIPAGQAQEQSNGMLRQDAENMPALSLPLGKKESQLLAEKVALTRFIALKQSVQSLEEKINSLQQAITLLTREVIQLKKIEMGFHQASDLSTVTRFIKKMKGFTFLNDFRIVLGVIILIFLLLTWKLWPKKREQETGDAPTSRVQGNLGKENYDYMGGTDTISAKINLAHAYIAMEDYQAARKILEEVSEHGGPEHQEEAKKLLNTLLPIS